MDLNSDTLLLWLPTVIVVTLHFCLCLFSFKAYCHIRRVQAPGPLLLTINGINVVSLFRCLVGIDPAGTTNIVGPAAAVPLSILSLCAYAFFLSGLLVVFVDEMSMIRAIPQLVAYTIRKNVLIITSSVVILIILTFTVAHAVYYLTTDANKNPSTSLAYILSRLACFSVVFILFLLLSVLLFQYSSKVLMKVEDQKKLKTKFEKSKDQEVAGFASTNATVHYTVFQKRLMYLPRRVSAQAAFVGLFGLLSLVYYGDPDPLLPNNVLTWMIFHTLMDATMFISMVDVLTSTSLGCCCRCCCYGTSPWNQSSSTRYKMKAEAQKKFMNARTGIDLEETSSSEDDEEYSNTFLFPVAHRMMESSGAALDDSKRMSVRL